METKTFENVRVAELPAPMRNAFSDQTFVRVRVESPQKQKRKKVDRAKIASILKEAHALPQLSDFSEDDLYAAAGLQRQRLYKDGSD